MAGGTVQLRFGKAVQAARQRLGVSQEAFAAELGMHRTQLGHIEQGLKDCRLSTIVRISAGLGLSVSQLLDQIDAKPRRRS